LELLQVLVSNKRESRFAAASVKIPESGRLDKAALDAVIDCQRTLARQMCGEVDGIWMTYHGAEGYRHVSRAPKGLEGWNNGKTSIICGQDWDRTIRNPFVSVIVTGLRE
jgi:hypothetical protein